MKLSKENLIPLIVACAFFMQQVNSTIVATALPQIAEAFDTTAVRMSIALTAYILSVAVFIPLSGWMADRFGGSLVFRAAIVIFTAASIWCGISNGPVELTLARIAQGVGGAMMVPVGRLVVLRTVAKADYVTAMAMIATPSLIGPVLGAPIGSFITTYASWRWIFLINVPFGIAGLILAWIYIENYPSEQRRPLDWLGFILSGVAMATLMAGIEALGRGDETWQLITVLLGIGVGVGLLAVRHLRRHPHPLMDLSLLRIRTFSTPNMGATWFRMSSQSMNFLLPLMFQVGFGMTAFASGLLTFASSLGALTMRAYAKPILQRFGFRNVLTRNTVLAGAAMAGCALFTEATPAWLIIFWLLIVGFFRALGNSSTTTLAYADIPSEKMGTATSFTQLNNQIGNALGVTAGAVVLHLSLAWRGAEHLTAIDFQVAMVVMGAISLISLPVFIRLPKDAGQELSGHKLT